MSKLEEIISYKQSYTSKSNASFSEIHAHVQKNFGQKALAVIVYGSCLSQTTQKKDSVPDYFIIADSFKNYYAKKWPSFLNSFLSPNIYHFEIPQGFSKYSVVSIHQLYKQTQFNQAKDLYFLGRFSKNIHVFWYKDEATQKKLIQIQSQACKSVALWVLSSLKLGQTLSLKDFTVKCIGLSYQGDVRVEAQDKVEKLFLAEEKFYLEVYEKILQKLHDKKTVYYDSKQQNITLLDSSQLSKHFKGFIFLSKLRSQLRWPKAMLTAKNWLDYVLLKIKRSYGEEFTLNEHEKKYWYLYGWKLLFKLNRKKLLK